MDNTITALQNLYIALGGDAADVANITIIPEMINAIAAQVTANKAAETEAETENTTEEESKS